jgi:RHS repeat-associated protein
MDLPEKSGIEANTDQKTAVPSISLPKAGGAIRGIGEKFVANPVTGTGSMSMPIATSPGRSGFGPQLSLSYDTGAGNGPFGFGWRLSIPSITRKTEKGLPQYRDKQNSDVFIFSDVEDLVPVYRQDLDGSWVASHRGFQRDPEGFWVRDQRGQLVIYEDELDGYTVRRFRPRIEGLFALVERWTKINQTDDVHWRSISKDNILTLYGRDVGSRIADPLNSSHIFSWLICETRDDKGNGILYRYSAEDGLGVDLGNASERNRGQQNDVRRTANRYLKRIYYGNRTSLLNKDGFRPRFLDEATVDSQIANGDWMFDVMFDYGEGHYAEESPGADGQVIARVQIDTPPGSHWPVRQDPFSTYRAGFELRTCRLCRRVLMFHHFSHELGIDDCLVRSTELSYSESAIASFIVSVTQSGYVRRPVLNQANRYLKKSMPPLEFEYSKVPDASELAQQPIRDIDSQSLENLPVGLDGSNYQWIDLDGEGTSGILTEQAGGWYYKRNLSAANLVTVNDKKNAIARLGATETVALKPALGLAGGGQFLDLAGDGQADLVQMEGRLHGFYERTDDANWSPFQPFSSWPDLNARDPNLKFVDLSGDGHPDILITQGEALTWYPSLAEEGFGPSVRVTVPLDEENGPRLMFADGTQSIYLADCSGDGLSDLVRIRNGEVCYWPNLGYGRFGAKVTMDNAPWFDNPDQFDQRRIRLVDTDGSGTIDILYLRRDGIQTYFNQSGNRWSDAITLPQFPFVENISSVQALDLLGNGTACLVWSTPLPGEARQPMHYLALMNEKPHLLIGVRNNLGAESKIQYAPSTRFYLDDKREGRPWITRLPFPVHVVEHVETYDHIARNHFVTRYAYHHGYFDGVEREFRGFGMVEQWDTQEFASLIATGTLPAENIDRVSHVPPVHTKTWFHTGLYVGSEHVSDYFAGLLNTSDRGEYFREPGLSDAEARVLLLDDTLLPAGLTVEEEREACRALKGAMLRQEVYADDAGPDATANLIRRAQIPYSVAEQNFTIRLLQPQGTNLYAVFLTHAREGLNCYYERNSADPRMLHALTLEADEFGNVLKEAAISYGRRKGQSTLQESGDRAKQEQTLITYTENRVTNAVDSSDAYRTPLSCEFRSYELTGLSPEKNAQRFSFDELVKDGFTKIVGLTEEQYEWDVDYAAPRKRLIQCVRTLFRPDDLGSSQSNDPLKLLALGKLQSLALTGVSYKLAFTPGLITQVLRRDSAPLLPAAQQVLAIDTVNSSFANRGGYVDLDADGHWWIPSGRSFFSAYASDTALIESAEAQAHFFQPRRYRDPFGQDSFVDFDPNDLLMVGTRDSVDNRVTVEASDYRVLQPRLVSDANRNRTEVAFDALGMVVATAVMGKPMPAPVEGDSLEGFITDVTPAQLDQFINEPRRLSADPNESEATQIVHDLLSNATTRIVYDIDRFMRLGEPAFAATIARETHFSDLTPNEKSKLQIRFSYSDGLGREIQIKMQAEPGPLDVSSSQAPTVNPRWVGSGWTIFNNKGKPIRQYEPFFSVTHRFESSVAIGVSSVVFYDPAERVIATLHPNDTYEKTVFDSWQQTTYDVNDTCAPKNAQTGDPRTDPDIGSYVAEYFKAQPATWQTWHMKRIGGALGEDERNAALRSAAHADTPTTVHLDALGRPFMTIARNRVVCAGHDLDGTEEDFTTRVVLDIEGNQCEVCDERKLPVDNLPTGAIEQRTVMRCTYHMAGPDKDANGQATESNRIYQLSMEAGARWMLNDVVGKPIRAWDNRGHNFVTAYDPLRRPMVQYVRGTTADSDPRTLDHDILVEKIEYGEGIPNAEAFNLRTRIYRQFDSAGIANSARLNSNGAVIAAYDFKGNLLYSTRQLLADFTAIPDWQLRPQVDEETFEEDSRYDALNRLVQSIAPHSSVTRAEHPNKFNVIQPVFNEANLLERLDVWLERASEPTSLLDPKKDAPSPAGVVNIDYNAKGQRLRIDYQNRVSSFYEYDPLTFRLTHLLTQRDAAVFPDDNAQPSIAGWPGQQTQNLSYTFDAAGNITHVQDDAQQAVYFRNKRVEPSNDFTYDAHYRLIQATGREHLGQNGSPTPHSWDDADRVGLLHPSDGNAMGTYIERYVYDAAGNLMQMQHARSDLQTPGWTRRYSYAESSLTQSGKCNNRLSRTTVGDAPVEVYSHDAHGNIVRMPHLRRMEWNYKDQLLVTARQAISASEPEPQVTESTYYVYDASGQRVRKVSRKSPGLTEERIYLGGFEVFRTYGGPIGESTVKLERETLHVMDDKQRIALVETRTLGKDQSLEQVIRYQLGNHLGSASLELDHQAQIISYEEYAPYGSSTYQATRSQTGTAKQYRYTGKERDEETGFSYHGARFYALWLGRWTSPDPAGLRGETNLFAYCRSNPIINTDPTGLENVVVVGSQYDTGAANHLMFAHQGISQVREYREKEQTERTTLVMFREGYSQEQLDAIQKEVRTLGGNFLVVDSANDLISYVNRGLLASESGPSNRSADKVSNLDFFSHGVVGAIELGYKTSRADEYRLDKGNVTKFDKDAFGKDDSPDREDNITSYACRTALGTFDYDQSHPTFEQSMGWDAMQYRYDFKVSQSLAQALADSANTNVVAYYVKTEYTDTLGSVRDRHDSCSSYTLRWGCSQTPELKESMSRRRDINGATFDPHGAMHPVKKGDMPTGMENQTGAVLVRPKSKGLPIIPYRPPGLWQ